MFNQIITRLGLTRVEVIGHYKAIRNVIIIPCILTIVFSNILMGLLYIVLVSIVYIFISKDDKKLNKQYFFIYIKVIGLGVILLTFLLLLIVIV
jgi:hypothetical protein